ncbi:MAG: hypothetical protein WC980_09185 [Candidatus Brocadiia bacterium]
MKRTFQLLIVVIIVLGGYIVLDFVQSRADEKLFQKQLETSVTGPAISNETINRGIAKEILVKMPWPSFEGTNVGKPVSQADVVVKSQLRLNGIIIEPGRPATAFIEDLISKQSGWYIENERLNEWIIVKITEDEVTLRNNAGEISRLTIERTWGAAITNSVVDLVKGAQNIVNMASPANMADMAKIIEPMLKKDVPIEQLRPQIQAIINTLPRKVIEDQLQTLGIAPSEIPPDTNLTDYAIKLLAIGRNEQVTISGAVVDMLFSLQVNKDNSPMTPTKILPIGKYRIYACFPNKDALKGISKAIIRWNNQTSGETVSMKLHSLDPNAPNNFIWLEAKEGWTRGTYEVELFRVNTAEKVASGIYRVE